MRGSMPEIGASLAVIVFSVPFLWVLLAVAVKRWHDLGKSGWMSLIIFIPIVGALWAFVELGFFPGTVGKNQYDLDSTPAAKTPDVASVKKPLPVANPVGDPIENSIGMVLVPIPAGEFMMGPKSESHRVNLTKSFHLGRTDVTQGQWKEVTGTTPWKGEDLVKEGDDYPAVWVTWKDAVEFCRNLSKNEGVEYRLPTEAEWEYACRAGTTTAYSFGDDGSQLGEYAWYGNNAGGAGEPYAHIVRQKKPNPWGLDDMHGNVIELCQDWAGEYPSGDVTDPRGHSTGSDRVFRGGAWADDASLRRSAFRAGGAPSDESGGLGFRVLRSSAK